jgi:hypothetical protein
MSDTSYFDAYMRGERSSSYSRKIRNMQSLEYMKFFTERRYVRSYSAGEGFSNPCQEVFIRESIERVESTLRWT